MAALAPRTVARVCRGSIRVPGAAAWVPHLGGALGLASAGRVRRHHVAIIGSGPSGFYTAKYLFKQVAAGSGPLQVDMFERLPTPFGLVRFGVAPDHPEVKNVTNDFAEVAATPGFRFLGNVEVGRDISMADLRDAYDAVVVCVGAQGEKLLGIPGEHLPGVIGAPAFVKWYNGHPDHVSLDAASPGEAAVVLGQGNVALDVARLLARSPKELHETDMHGPALARVAEWQRNGLRTVHVVGRRGFVQAAFTNKELRELLTCSEEMLPVVDPEELARCRNPASEQELASSRMKKRSVEILEEMASNFSQRESTSKRVVWLRFLRSPAEILPATDGNQVGAIRLERTELQGAAGQQVAVRATSSTEGGALSEDIPCGLVVRSVGFDITPLDGLPLDGRRRVPHNQGRVEAPQALQGGGPSLGGLYVAGWVKRGPQGIIGTNIVDAQETAARLAADLKEVRPGASGAAVDRVEAKLAASGRRIVSFADWAKLEQEELKRGAASGRAAEKLTDVNEMLRLLDG